MDSSLNELSMSKYGFSKVGIFLTFYALFKSILLYTKYNIYICFFLLINIFVGSSWIR